MIIDWNRRNYLGPAAGWIEYRFGGTFGLILTTFAETFKAIAAVLGFRAEPQMLSFRAKGRNLIFKAKK